MVLMPSSRRRRSTSNADLEMTSKLLDKLTPPEGKPVRYRPDDAPLAVLKSL